MIRLSSIAIRTPSSCVSVLGVREASQDSKEWEGKHTTKKYDRDAVTWDDVIFASAGKLSVKGQLGVSRHHSRAQDTPDSSPLISPESMGRLQY